MASCWTSHWSSQSKGCLGMQSIWTLCQPNRLPTRASICSSLAFSALNILDAWLTRQLIAMGGREANPIVVPYGDNMLIKGLLALVIVLLLVRFARTNLLWILNVCMLAIVLWNGICLWIL